MSRFPVWPLGGTHFSPGPWALGSALGLLLIQPHSMAFVQHLSQSPPPQGTRCQAASGRGQEGGVLVGQKRAGRKGARGGPAISVSVTLTPSFALLQPLGPTTWLTAVSSASPLQPILFCDGRS